MPVPPIQMAVNIERAVVTFRREGSFIHPGCPQTAIVEVQVTVDANNKADISSLERWTCEACGLDDVGLAKAHPNLADALSKLPPPPPGEMDTDDLAAQMLVDMQTSWSDLPRGAFGQPIAE